MINMKHCLAIGVVMLAGGVLAAIFFPLWLLVTLLALVLILIGCLLFKN
ncbi:MAG: hypothetical protein RR436_02475 [Clostridia bacterium]